MSDLTAHRVVTRSVKTTQGGDEGAGPRERGSGQEGDRDSGVAR